MELFKALKEGREFIEAARGFRAGLKAARADGKVTEEEKAQVMHLFLNMIQELIEFLGETSPEVQALLAKFHVQAVVEKASSVVSSLPAGEGEPVAR